MFVLSRIAFLCCILAVDVGCGDDASEVELIGWAVLPADTFVGGPTSGQFISASNGKVPPFRDQQPVQGFSALIREEDGRYLALADNGFGKQEDSPDVLLRVYVLRPDLRTESGGTGQLHAESAFILRDPDGLIPFPIIADQDTYPGSDIPVDPRIRDERLLTGADFDPESFRRVPDGTYYIGDEFGPFLLHVDGEGSLVEPPIELPGVRSPQHPLLGDAEPNLSRSGGFESMALSADGKTLHPMLEHSLQGQEGQINIYAFDLASGTYTHSDPYDPPHRYKLDPMAIAPTDLTAIAPGRFLVIERDGGQGPEARFKKVFEITLGEVDGEGFLQKTQVLDLLDIADPHNLGGPGERFTFPFETTEALVVIESGILALVNDNNYPFSVGRHVTDGQPDDTAFILLRVPITWRP
jgi:hypothetical protein